MFRFDKTFFIITVLGLSTFPAVDIYLPSLPGMAHYFATSEEAIRSTITAYLIGSVLATLPLGIYSDRIGRKPVLIVGLISFLIGSVLCFIADNYLTLLVGRFLEGIGATSIPVVGFIVIHESYPQHEATTKMTWLGALMSGSPLISPSIGAAIDTLFGWRWNFALLSVLGAFALFCSFYLSETTKKTTQNTHFITQYKSVLKHRIFILTVLTFSLLCVGEWCYLTLAPFIFEKTLGLTVSECGSTISAIACSYFFVALLTPWFIKYFGINKTIIISVALSCIGATELIVCFLLQFNSVICVALGLACYLSGLSLVWGPTATKALQCFEQSRGIASSTRSLLLCGCCAVGSSLGATLSFKSILPLALCLFACALTSALCYYLSRTQSSTSKALTPTHT